MSAATEAYIRAKTGRSFYELLGDKAYNMGGNDTCTEGDLDAYLVSQTEFCFVLQRVSTEGCSDANQCVRLHISPALLAEPQYLPAVEAALRNPCGSITDWRTLKWGDASTPLGLAPKHSERLLHCDDNEVIGTSVTRSPDNQFFELHFQRGE